MHFIDPRKVYVWLHTWHAKDHISPAAIASVRYCSDVGHRLVVERQGPDDERVAFAIAAWRRALASGAEWILRLPRHSPGREERRGSTRRPGA